MKVVVYNHVGFDFHDFAQLYFTHFIKAEIASSSSFFFLLYLCVSLNVHLFSQRVCSNLFSVFVICFQSDIIFKFPILSCCIGLV